MAKYVINSRLSFSRNFILAVKWLLKSSQTRKYKKPQLPTEQKNKKNDKYLELYKMIILNNSDFLKIEQTNNFQS